LNKTYRTISGDTWDSIALQQMGSELHMTRLMEANRKHRAIFTFPAGIELVIPEVPDETAAGLPPWKQ